MAESKIKTVIIDDENPSIETLQWKLKNYCPQVEVVAFFDNPVEGVEFLKGNQVELLFLDIEMPLLNGFDVLEELGREVPFDVIFTTAYDNFGIRAVKFSALDYLLKPVQNKELQQAVEKHLKKTSHRVSGKQVEVLLDNVEAEKRDKPFKIALATKESIEFVVPKEIITCTSDSNYTIIYLQDGRKLLISKTLKEFEEMLQPFNFFRTHNSHLVNLEEIQKFIRSDGGYLVLKNKMKIPVSKNRKDGLLDRLS